MSSGTSVKWSIHCAHTQPGDVVVVVGASSALGRWNPVRGVPLETDDERFPIWATPEYVALPKSESESEEPQDNSDAAAPNIPLIYKYFIYNPKGQSLKWEPFPGDRQIKVAQDTYSTVQDVWGNPDVSRTAVIRCRRTSASETTPAPSSCADADQAAVKVEQNSLTKVSNPTDMSNEVGSFASLASDSTHSASRGQVDADASKQPPLSHTKKPLQRPHLRRQFRREVFILSNSGSLTDRYEEQQVVGRGTWGEVKVLCQMDSGAKRACKKIPKYFVEDIDRFRQEMNLMKSLDHPNIVRLYETFEDASDIHLVMEYCAGERLCVKCQSSFAGLLHNLKYVFRFVALRLRRRAFRSAFRAGDVYGTDGLCRDETDSECGGLLPLQTRSSPRLEGKKNSITASLKVASQRSD